MINMNKKSKSLIQSLFACNLTSEINSRKRMTYRILISLFNTILLVSCSNDDNLSNYDTLLNTKNNSTPVVVEPMLVTKSKTSDIDLYHIKYKDINLSNVKLTKSEVSMLKSAKSIETVSVDVYGYSGWTNWESGRPRPYKRSISSDNVLAQLCGIAPGVYFTNDVYLEQTYTLPTSMAVILDNNNVYPTNTTDIGWNPDSLSIRGYKASLSGSTVKLQTAVWKLDYTISGQQTYRTYPANYSNVVWKLKYLKINP